MARNHNNPLATSISEKGNPRSLTKRRHKPVKRTKHKPAARLGKSNSFRLSNSSAEAHIALNPPPQRVEQAQVHVPIDEHSEDEEILDGEDEFGERMISESTSSSFQCVLRRKDDEDSGESSLKDVSSLRGSHCNSNSHIDSPIPENGKLATLHADPDEEYPPVCTDFLGVPPSAIGDMLQVWEFVTAFSKTLRLTPFKLIHLQQAVVHSERSSLVDSCIVRLVQTIISDKGLVEELGISESVVKALTEMDPKRVVGSTLDGLPNILSFESDEVDDHLLHATVKKLATVSSRWAFYKTIDPGARFRVLRELVDYATMTDALRKCVSDSMEHTEEEKKKAREEHSANRKRLQLQIRELRTELADYKVKNGLVDNGSQTEAGKVDANGNGKESGRKSESASMSTEREEAMTRQEKLRVLQRERREREDRKSKERGAELIISKIEKIRGSLKALKTVRQRGRGKEGSNGEIMRPYSNMAPSVQREDPVRTYAIGSDREDRCYWFFQGSGRIWIENTRNGDWYTLTNSESIQGLLKWLSPYRKEEELLKENILHHLELIESEMEQEAKDILQVELEMQEVMRLDAQRTTRARKRKASMEAQLKTKKCGSIPTFLDYHNAEI